MKSLQAGRIDDTDNIKNRQDKKSEREKQRKIGNPWEKKTW